MLLPLVRLVFHGFRWVLLVFQGSRMVFHGFRWVLLVIQGSRIVFHGFRWILLVIQGSRRGFHGSRWVLWFFKVPGWPAARNETVRTSKRYSLHLYLVPTIPLGLAGRRPALA